MKKLKDIKYVEFIERILKWNYMPFIIFGCFIFILHFRFTGMFADDIWFSDILRAGNYNILTYSLWRYESWTSRTILEAMVLLGVNMPAFLWRLTNTIIIVTIGVFLSKIFIGDEHRFEGNIVIVSLMSIYPYYDVISVGMVAGSVNYFWPLAFALIAAYSLHKIINGKKIKKYEYMIYVVSLLFGVNNEQICFVMLTAYAVCAIHLLLQRRVNTFVLIQFGICLLSLIYILTCPGNAFRMIKETATWFPEYASFSFLQKIDLGISAVIQKIFFTDNRLFMTFAFLMFVLIWQTRKNVLYRITAAIPLLVLILLSVLYQRTDYNNLLMKLLDIIKLNGIIHPPMLHSFKIFLLFLGMLVSCGCLIISPYMLLGKGKNTLVATGILLVGFATKAMMGFSSTIWASGERTAFLLMFSVIACIAYILNCRGFSDKKETQLLLLMMVVFGIYGGIENMFPV